MCNHEMLFTLSIQIRQLNVWNVENLVIHKKALSNVTPIFTTDNCRTVFYDIPVDKQNKIFI